MVGVKWLTFIGGSKGSGLGVFVSECAWFAWNINVLSLFEGERGFNIF